ncbi:MAG: hypothetical protein LBR79_00380 [Oscillospiraceae bacterium]|nr:hypothetical protein [Oscillospiraceae bacterium]
MYSKNFLKQWRFCSFFPRLWRGKETQITTFLNGFCHMISNDFYYTLSPAVGGERITNINPKFQV